MHLSDALKLINENHPDGCVEFFSKMKDDPWDKAHRDLDTVLKMRDTDASVSIQAFYAEIRRLQDVFKSSGVKQKAHPANIGFYAPSEKMAAARFAKQEQCCVVCLTDKNLQIIKVEGKPTPCCESCVLKLQADPQMPLF
jgi:hypothetical protein